MGGRFLAGCGSDGESSTASEATASPTAAPTAAAAGDGFADVEGLKFVGWDFQPDTIQAHLDTWSGITGVPVDLEIVPSIGYAPALQTKLRGGERLDLFYNFTDNIGSFVEQGWAQDISDLPGVDDMLGEMYESSKPRYVTSDGRVIATPYFSAVHMLHYNPEQLEAAGFSGPPSTKEEVFDQCEKLKADGIAESPYSAFWDKQFIPQYFPLYLLADGIVPFGPNGEPAFADDAGTVEVLEWWQAMYQEGMTPGTILTDDPTKNAVNIANGTSAFYLIHHYFLGIIRSLEGTEAAKIVHAPQVPGTSGTTLQIGEVLQMGAETEGAAREAAFDLMKTYGWRDEGGDFSVLATWAEAAGLGAPYPAFWADPEIVALFPDFYDLPLISETFESKSEVQPPNPASLPWYSDFIIDQGDLVHELLLGQRTPAETVTALADSASAWASGEGGL